MVDQIRLGLPDSVRLCVVSECVTAPVRSLKEWNDKEVDSKRNVLEEREPLFLELCSRLGFWVFLHHVALL